MLVVLHSFLELEILLQANTVDSRIWLFGCRIKVLRPLGATLSRGSHHQQALAQLALARSPLLPSPVFKTGCCLVEYNSGNDILRFHKKI